MLATGNKILDMEIPLLTLQELEDLARYAKYLRWSRTENIDWADMPLTAEEEAGLIQGRENIKSGNFMTPAELKRHVNNKRE